MLKKPNVLSLIFSDNVKILFIDSISALLRFTLFCLRFGDISSYNPLYSLVAAEYIKTLDENPILKRENSTSYVEYRFGLGVS